jgi:hypothetical protein
MRFQACFIKEKSRRSFFMLYFFGLAVNFLLAVKKSGGAIRE